jgi:hypothetical protein
MTSTELVRASLDRMSQDPSAASTCAHLIAHHGLSLDRGESIGTGASTSSEEIDRAAQAATGLLSKGEVGSLVHAPLLP